MVISISGYPGSGTESLGGWAAALYTAWEPDGPASRLQDGLVWTHFQVEPYSAERYTAVQAKPWVTLASPSHIRGESAETS